MVKNRGGENGIILPGGENGSSLQVERIPQLRYLTIAAGVLF